MMNSFRSLLLALIFALPLTALPSGYSHAQEVVVSYQTFYDELSPYGQWVNDGYYGHVWVPNVAPGFRPYASDGHWVMTDQGNMWVSDEPWSWACYHYGRWTYNNYYGWVWVPGHEWAPAWVSWRSGGGYYGWAPMGPGHEFGSVYDYPESYWVFVSPDYLYHPSVYSYYERGEVSVYYRRTNYIRYEGNDHYYYGPRREAIERETHQPVQVYRVSNAREAGAVRMNDREVNIYRPAVNRESVRMARPANVVDGREHPINRAEPYSQQAARPAFHEEHPRQQQRQFQEQPRNQQQNYQLRQPEPQHMQSVPQQNQQFNRSGNQPQSQPAQQSAPQPQRQQAPQSAPQPQHPQAPQQQRQAPPQRQQAQPRQQSAPQQQHRDRR